MKPPKFANVPFSQPPCVARQANLQSLRRFSRLTRDARVSTGQGGMGTLPPRLPSG